MMCGLLMQPTWRFLDWVAISALVALSTIDHSSAQFQCPAGSTAVSGGGGIMCQCPDGSFAGLYSGCPKQSESHPQQQTRLPKIPPGSSRCGTGLCPVGTKCVGGRTCLPANAVDCGNGQSCPGEFKC